MRNDKIRGFSMIEVLISLAVFAIISLAIFALIDAGSTSYNQTTRLNQLQENGRKALDELAQDLRMANPAGNSFMVTLESDGSNKISFYRVTELLRDGQDGYDEATGKVNYTAYPIEYFVVPSMADANNNGIVDEWRLVRREYVAVGKYTESQICDYVEPKGFVVERDPSDNTKKAETVTLTLKLMVADSKQSLIRKTVSTKIMIRNKIL